MGFGKGTIVLSSIKKKVSTSNWNVKHKLCRKAKTKETDKNRRL